MKTSFAAPTSQWGERPKQMDPLGEVDLEDPGSVETAIRVILNRHYRNGFNAALLGKAVQDVVMAYRGEYPGLLRCEMLHHDLRHALETGLTTARLLDGYAMSPALESQDRIGGQYALLCVLVALFHNIGLLRRDTETDLWGPVLIPIHEERSVKFIRRYLSETALAPFANYAKLVMATKLLFRIPDSWSVSERRLASMVGTADLLSRCSDRCHVEEDRDILLVELAAFGLGANAGSLYSSGEPSLPDRPGFISGMFRQRLDDEFLGVYRLLELHAGQDHPWKEAIQRNLDFLEGLLRRKRFAPPATPTATPFPIALWPEPIS